MKPTILKSIIVILLTIYLAAPCSATETAASFKEKATADISETEDAGSNTEEEKAALLSLPPYPEKASVITGTPEHYTVDEEDTLLDIARHFKLGFIEVLAANSGVDPWTPTPGKDIFIPKQKLLPRAKQKGIVVNLGQMRLYYFKDGEAEPLSFPIGVGREGLRTPTGETTIIKKKEAPIWYPTERMREEKIWLPAAIPPGASNPLGTHALYLGWPTFLIHGSNKPWAIGRRVSSGCMRMYPEGIKELFAMVETGTHVTIVDQPLLLGWEGDKLYMEANPSKEQGKSLEINGNYKVEKFSDEVRQLITAALGESSKFVNWSLAQQAFEEKRGYPVVIADKAKPQPVKQKTKTSYKYNN